MEKEGRSAKDVEPYIHVAKVMAMDSISYDSGDDFGEDE